MLSIRTDLIHALPTSNRRCFNRAESASYVGVSTMTFDKLVNSGVMPQPIKLVGRNVWDIRALDRAIDELSGIDSHRSAGVNDNEDDLDRELAAFGAKHGYT